MQCKANCRGDLDVRSSFSNFSTEQVKRSNRVWKIIKNSNGRGG